MRTTNCKGYYQKLNVFTSKGTFTKFMRFMKFTLTVVMKKKILNYQMPDIVKVSMIKIL